MQQIIKTIIKRKLLLTILVLGILTQTCSLGAKEVKVVEVEVTGNEIFSKESILEVVETAIGKSFSKSILTKDIKEIYNLGMFNEVKIDLVEKEEGIKVTFIVEEKPTISEVKFLNNKEINEEKLKEEYILVEGDLYDEIKLKESIIKLENFYRKEGFYYIKIEPQINTIEPHLIKIALKIKEGTKTEIKKVNFIGNKSFSSWRLRWTISSKKGDYFIKEKISEDLEQITHFYNNNGYILCKANLGKVYYDNKKKGLVVNIHIAEGDSFTINEIELRGYTLFKEKELLEEIKTYKGKTYSLKKIREDQYRIMEKYSKEGYILVRVTPKPIIDKKEKKVSFSFEIAEGEKCYLEKITVSGNKITKDKVILREVLLRPGDIFNGHKVNTTHQKLYQLGFFEYVNMEVKPGSEKNKKLLNIEVKERKTGTISLGTTWSNRYGFGGSIGVSQTNLFGKAYQLNIKSEFGHKKTDYRIGFVNPWLRDTPTSLGLNIYNTRQTINEYTTTQKGGSISIGRPWKTFNKIYLDYKYEKVLFSNVNLSSAPSDIIEKEGIEEATSSFSTSFIRDTRDRIYHTTKGYRILYSNEFAGDFLGGDVDYYKSIVEGRIYLPLWWKFVLAIRSRFGTVKSITGDDKVRDDFRFYLGGADTIRGYRENSIFLVDNNKEHGGNSVFYTNIEYRFPIVNPLYFAFFLDMGNIWDEYKHFNLDKLKFGKGFSFRIDTPMGPIRLDYGYPMRDKDRKEPEFYFSIGTPF
ncbi:MAG: outer membrane protein assembly factor BamA [bacterium]|nr:outer membrane protein assembly factor BamA [bacterium]